MKRAFTAVWILAGPWTTVWAQIPQELVSAIEREDVEAAKAFIAAQKPDLSLRRENDRVTALHLAARTGNVAMVEVLVGAGADVNADSQWGTPAHALFLAPPAKRCRPEAFEILLKKGADLSAKTEQHGTLLHRAVFENCPEIVRLFLAKGAAVNAKATYLQQTPLHTAIREAKGDRDALVRLLIEQKADVNAPNARGDTPLHYAVAFGEPTHVQILVDAGAKTDLVNKEGKTPLDLAKAQKETDKIKILQKAGAKK
ncbi:MAG: ankyrin repeat domain-containing protein [Bacteroidia bacterium]|nr:ankyrin repeat domain-containing protein [Bacteroidia bacterium]MDW8333448.1 ankyrin repeat domain-containing protein [Bacteroidia bacterium]